MEVAKAAKENLDVILIGHEGHPEVEGTLGQMPSDASSRALLIESPEDVDALTWALILTAFSLLLRPRCLWMTPKR